VILRSSQPFAPAQASATDNEEDLSTALEHTNDRNASPPSSPPVKPGKSSGSIIGKHKFKHNPEQLERHLELVFGFWMGNREPQGVSLEEARRCAWCEFENDCEWR